MEKEGTQVPFPLCVPLDFTNQISLSIGELVPLSLVFSFCFNTTHDVPRFEKGDYILLPLFYCSCIA